MRPVGGGRCAALAAFGFLFWGGAYAAPSREGASGLPSEGRLLVLNKHDDTLMVFDAPSHRLLATVKVGDEPHEVVATPDGRKAYVSNVKGRSVSVVDLGAYKVTRTLRSQNLETPHGLALTPDGRQLLLTSEGSRRLFQIDAARDVVERSLTTSQARAHMVAIGQGGRRAFVANVGSNSITVLRLPELRVARHIKVGSGPEGIATTPNGKWVLVALQGTDQVAILDAGDGQILGRLPTGRTPVRIAVVPRSSMAVVSNRGSNDVTILDILERRVKTTVRVGAQPGGLTTNARGTRAYVCNNGSNSISVVTLPGFEVAEEIAAGAHPDGIAFVASRR